MKMRIYYTLTVLIVATTVLLSAASIAAAEDSYTFSGRGTAHGVGLDMAGVQALAANHGKGYQEILKTYYTGVDISAYSGNPWMRIGILNGGDIQVTSDRSYWAFVDNGGAIKTVPAGIVTHVSYAAGNYITTIDGIGTWTCKNHTWFGPVPGGYLKLPNNGRRYRDNIEVRHSESGLLWAINVIDIENYVKGIAEEPNTWPTEAQRTLAVAARTYALNKQLYSTRWDSENFDLDATLGSQYYLGLDAERSNLVAAADFTRGQVVTYGGKIIVAAYHGNSGGYTESFENVWGGSASDYPYLRGVPSPWTSAYHWGPKTFTKAQLQGIFNSRPSSCVGTLYSIDFSDRTASGRLRKVKLVGSDGTREIWGYSEFASWLGLPSALIDVAAPKDKWDWQIRIQSVSSKTANVKLIFMFPKGKKKAVARLIQPHGRAVVVVDKLVSPGALGAMIESDQPVVAERVNFFNYTNKINGAHGSLGSDTVSKNWYLAEGRTGKNFDAWVSILNPRSVKAHVTATFMPGNGKLVRKSIVLSPQSRKTLYVDRIPGLGSVPVPVVVTADQPVVVERADYLKADGYRGGHSSRASSTLSKTWYFAEGFTGAGSKTRLQILNPSNHTTTVRVWLSKSNGKQVKHRIKIGSKRRVALLLNRWVSGDAFGITVKADDPVVAERTVYFKNADKVGVHSSVGSPTLSKTHYFAAAETKSGFDEFISVFNPCRTPAKIKIAYIRPNGNVLRRTVHTVKPESRGTFAVAHEIGGNRSASIQIISNRPIAAENVTYFKKGSRSGGYAILGAESPAKHWYFSEGAVQ
jgi:SpoIID/LytB domain protein